MAEYNDDYVEELEEALKFYADKTNWDLYHVDGLSGYTSSARNDAGERARKALEGGE